MIPGVKPRRRLPETACQLRLCHREGLEPRPGRCVREHAGRPHSGYSAAAPTGYYQQAQAIFRQIGDQRTEAEIFLLGHSQETATRPGAARQSRQQALALFDEPHDPRPDQMRATPGTQS